jgi:hypothetical protein
LLRAAYIKTSGSRISRLENIKRATVEFFSYVDVAGSGSGSGGEKTAEAMAKHQLQEDIATLRRVKRVPLPGNENVDMKKLLQSG